MKIDGKVTKKGRFDFDTLTVKFGGEMSKPENRFTAQAIKVPDYVIKVMERADAGSGCYYTYKEEVEYEIKNAYIIVREYLVRSEKEIMGWIRPMRYEELTDLLPIDWKHTDHQVKKFAKEIIL